MSVSVTANEGEKRKLLLVELNSRWDAPVRGSDVASQCNSVCGRHDEDYHVTKPARGYENLRVGQLRLSTANSVSFDIGASAQAVVKNMFLTI